MQHPVQHPCAVIDDPVPTSMNNRLLMHLGMHTSCAIPTTHALHVLEQQACVYIYIPLEGALSSCASCCCMTAASRRR